MHNNMLIIATAYNKHQYDFRKNRILNVDHTYSVAKEGGVGLPRICQAGKDEAEATLGGQARNVLHEGYCIERICALGVGAHFCDDALGCRGGAGAEREEESSLPGQSLGARRGVIVESLPR